MNTYIAIYKGRQIEVQAETTYTAQRQAAETLHARKPWDVAIMLAAKDGEPVTHDGAELN